MKPKAKYSLTMYQGEYAIDATTSSIIGYDEQNITDAKKYAILALQLLVIYLSTMDNIIAFFLDVNNLSKNNCIAFRLLSYHSLYII